MDCASSLQCGWAAIHLLGLIATFLVPRLRRNVERSAAANALPAGPRRRRHGDDRRRAVRLAAVDFLRRRHGRDDCRRGGRLQFAPPRAARRLTWMLDCRKGSKTRRPNEQRESVEIGNCLSRRRIHPKCMHRSPIAFSRISSCPSAFVALRPGGPTIRLSRKIGKKLPFGAVDCRNHLLTARTPAAAAPLWARFAEPLRQRRVSRTTAYQLAAAPAIAAAPASLLPRRGNMPRKILCLAIASLALAPAGRAAADSRERSRRRSANRPGTERRAVSSATTASA